MPKITIGHTDSAATLYAVFIDETGDFWNGSAFESFVGANWATYDVALNEWGSSAIYRATIPAFAAGHYIFIIKDQAGGSPAQGDATVGAGGFDWDGSDISDLAAIIAHGDAEWATVTAAVIGGAVLTTAANKLATNASGEVTPTAAAIAAIATAVWAAAARTLTASTNLTAGIAQAVWEYATRVLTAGTNLPTAASITTAVWAAATRTLTAFGFTVTETNSAAILAVTDKLDDTLEDDGGTYRFTTNALEQAPDGGAAPTAAAVADAVWDEAKAGHVAAGSFGLEIAAATQSEAVMDQTVDGAVNVRAALKALRAFAVGKWVQTDTSPQTWDLYNAAGDTVIATLEFAADERTPS